jgi:hypothetical protein
MSPASEPKPLASMPTRALVRALAHVGGFFFTVLELGALGALLGALAFPLFGWLADLAQSPAELVLAGAKSGGFYFFVWAPGAALVREFIRGAKKRQAH